MTPAEVIRAFQRAHAEAERCRRVLEEAKRALESAQLEENRWFSKLSSMRIPDDHRSDTARTK